LKVLDDCSAEDAISSWSDALEIKVEMAASIKEQQKWMPFAAISCVFNVSLLKNWNWITDSQTADQYGNQFRDRARSDRGLPTYVNFLLDAWMSDEI
jgi:hypothetical protein